MVIETLRTFAGSMLISRHSSRILSKHIINISKLCFNHNVFFFANEPLQTDFNQCRTTGKPTGFCVMWVTKQQGRSFICFSLNMRVNLLLCTSQGCFINEKHGTFHLHVRACNQLLTIMSGSLSVINVFLYKTVPAGDFCLGAKTN